jgi:hypothetical protein
MPPADSVLPKAKKPYTPPVLIEWGSLRDITQSAGYSGRLDGGKGKQPRRTR